MPDRQSLTGLENATGVGAEPFPLRGLSLGDLLSRLLNLNDDVHDPVHDEATGEAGGRVPPQTGAHDEGHIGPDPDLHPDFSTEALSMAPKLPKNIPIGWLGKLAGKAGDRIPEPQQTGVSAMDKVPRFRSDQGTFVRHEGEWWRLEPQPPLDPNVTLSRLDKETGAVLEQKRVSVQEMIDSAKQNNAYNNALKRQK